MSNNKRISEQIELPSGGIIYEEKVNPNIELESMKTKHEMLRLSATEDDQKLIASIIDDCTTSDNGISSYDMCLGDFQYMLYKLRVVTFGPEYELIGECPFCKFRQPLKVNLDEIKINSYDDSILELLDVELPMSKHKVKLTLQTPKSIDRINRKTKEYQKRHKDSNENPVIMYSILESIEEIDDEKPNIFTLEEFIKELPLADTNILLNRIDEINSKIGLDLYEEAQCKVCGTTYQVPFRITNEFFRPNIK